MPAKDVYRMAAVSVRLDGHEIGLHQFPVASFDRITFPMELSAGPHLITLEYAAGTGTPPGNQMAVLYSEMKLVKTRPPTNP